jgi:hypothetical protein
MAGKGTPRKANNMENVVAPNLDPGVQRVLRIFKGTIVKENRK